MTISYSNKDKTLVKRFDNIDLLRGLSILAVILIHINLRIPFAPSALGQHFSQPALKVLLWSGYYGVIVFFVISGFLITISSLQRWGSLQNIRYDQFYLMRFARIMPCLITLLIILSILDCAGVKGFVIKTHTPLWQAVFSALTFHLNWLEAKNGYLPGGWDVLWSLSVEETFYLFFPLICRVVKTELYFSFIMLLFIIIGPFARCIFSNNEIWQDHSYFSCMDGIALGCLAALAAHNIKISSKWLSVILFSGLILFIFIVVFRKQAYEIGLTITGLNVTVLEIGTALMAMAFYKQTTTKSFINESLTSPLRWFGKNSYEIYLTHMFIVTFMTQAFYATHQSINMAPIWYIGMIVLCGICGHLVAKYYSIPFNKFLRRANYATPLP